MEEAAREALRAGQIVRRLRDFVARGEADNAVHDLPEMIVEATRLGFWDRVSADSALHQIRSRTRSSVLADRVQIQQVLVNLFRNAADAVADSDRRDIIVTTRRDGGMIMVGVADTGPASRPRSHPASSRHSRRARSRAWALACRSAARSSRRMGDGYGPNEAKRAEAFFVSRSGAARWRREMADARHVHIVDDEDSVRRSIAFMLKTSGFTVTTWNSGTAFLQTARTAEPGCVLLDIRMPGMDGLQVQQELARRGHGLPVIVLTGHGDTSRRR